MWKRYCVTHHAIEYDLRVPMSSSVSIWVTPSSSGLKSLRSVRYRPEFSPLPFLKIQQFAGLTPIDATMVSQWKIRLETFGWIHASVFRRVHFNFATSQLVCAVHGVHFAQEYENRFWTIFALLFSTALFFAQDSPFCFGRYSPTLGSRGVVASSYAMHLWDWYMHRVALSRQTLLHRSMSLNHFLNEMRGTVEEQLAKINSALLQIDQLLIPSTINNFIN
jgi:hypothetical protein